MRKPKTVCAALASHLQTATTTTSYIPQAYCDDNYTQSVPPCQQDGEIPPQSALSEDGIKRLGGIKFWGECKNTLLHAGLLLAGCGRDRSRH